MAWTAPRCRSSTAEGSVDLPGPRVSSYLTISDEHIRNVMFDRHVFRQTRAGLNALESEYRKVVELSVHAEGKGTASATLDAIRGSPDSAAP